MRRLSRRRRVGHADASGVSAHQGFGTAGSEKRGTLVIVLRIVGTMAPVASAITTWPTIAKHTKLMVLFGGMAPKNTQVNMGGIGRHESQDWLVKVRQAGVTFVSISPLRDNAAAALGAEWLPLRPNTDVAMMLGLAHTLIVEGLHDRAFLDTYTVGFERLRAYLMGETDGTPKDADWAANITQIPAPTIRDLARRMAAVRTMLAASWSVQRTDHGEQPYWMLIALAAMLGQIGLPGGGFGFGYGATSSIGSPQARMPLPKLPTGSNPVQAYIPVARFSDMLLHPGARVNFNGQQLTYPISDWSTGAAAIPSTRFRILIACCAPGRNPKPSLFTSRDGPRRRGVPISCYPAPQH